MSWAGLGHGCPGLALRQEHQPGAWGGSDPGGLLDLKPCGMVQDNWREQGEAAPMRSGNRFQGHLLKSLYEPLGGTIPTDSDSPRAL